MKLLSYTVDGIASFGALKDGGVVDGPSLLGQKVPSLRAALEQDLLPGFAQKLERAAITYQLPQIEYLPPIPESRKVLCIGVNYVDHRAESGVVDVPSHPTVFTRFSDSHVGHGQPIVRPAMSEQLDYEGEVAIVIGGPVDASANDEALLGSIAGLSCYNDVSVRDWQLHNSQWVPGKNFAGVGAFGPWLVTLDEFDDLGSVRLTTRVNGEVVQDATLGDLIFDFAAILRYVAAFTPLSAGDVIVTGTPGGVGVVANPPRFLQPGDVMEVEVSGAGVLRNVVEAAPDVNRPRTAA